MRARSISLLAALSVFAIACQKSASNESAKLEATKTSAVKLGEPISFSANTRGDVPVNWQVSPATNVVIRSSGNKASILFNHSGSYSVMASSSQGMCSTIITVTDSIYHYDSTYHGTGSGSGSGSGWDTTGYHVISLTGDSIRLTPSKLSSDSSGYLLITGITARSFNCLNTYLQSTVTKSGPDFTINFTGVGAFGGSSCTPGWALAAGNSYLYPVSDGVHTLYVIVNGITYTGTFTKNGGSYTFNWPNNPYVTFTKNVLN